MVGEYLTKALKWAFVSLFLVVATNSFISLTEMIYPVENWNPWAKSLAVWTLLAVLLTGVSTTFIALWQFAKAALHKDEDKFEAELTRYENSLRMGIESWIRREKEIADETE